MDKSSVAEGGVLTYTVSLVDKDGNSVSVPAGENVNVQLSWSGEASLGADTSALPTSVNVTGGSTAIFTVTAKDDYLAEGTEPLVATISGVIDTNSNFEAVAVGTTNVANSAITDDDITPITVTVSEEGLSNGIEDTSGTPTDTTNETKVDGTIDISNLTLSSNKEFTLNIPTVNLTSNGTTIIWVLSSDGKELKGTVNSEDAIVITVNNSGNYEVELLKAIDHPINSVEDILSFDVKITVQDGSFETNASLTVNIEDDMPTVETSSTTWTQSINIPDIFTGNVSFVGNGGTNSSYTFANGAVIVTGKGFTSSTDLTLKDANLSQNSGGLGVASTSSPYHNVANEVDFRKTADGQAASEELIIKLADDKISYGAKINFAFMYGGELEVGIAEFYRDGVLVSTQTFSSNASSGNYAANFEVLDGGFDTIIIKATDNGNSFNIKDNSDFAVTSVEFIGTTSVQPISYAEGTITYDFGADGAGNIGFTEVTDTVKLTDGSSVTITVTNNSIIAKDSTGNLVFQVQLTPSTGKWEFYQYQNFLIGDGTEELLDIDFRITDADGDGIDGSISIGVNKLPTSTDDNITIDEDQSYTLTINDFGSLSDDVTKVKIETLPTNGILLLAGVQVLAGQVITLSDIESGKLVFKPTANTDDDSSFSFKIYSGTLWSSSSFNTDINITAIADTPVASINVIKTELTKIGSDISNQTSAEFGDLDLKIAKAASTSGSEDLNCDLNKSSSTSDITKNYQNLNANNVITGSGNDTLYFQSVNSGKTISTGAGDDKVVVSQSLNGTVNLGDGTNSLGIVGSFNNGTVTAGSGNDTVIVNQGASGVTINLGNGNNDISIGYALNSSSVTTGSGNDTLVVGQAVDNSTIKTGAGDDKVQLEHNVQGTKIYLEDGNDSIKLSSESYVNFNINTVIDGGKGQDTLYFSGKMEDYKVSVGVDAGTSALITWAEFVEMNKDVNGYANKVFTIYEVDSNGTLQGSKFVVTNIENVVFESSQESGTVITTYSYEVDISAALADTDGSETLTVTITNVPTGATLSSDTYTLVDNGNNTWSVTIPAGVKSISDSLTLTTTESNVDNINLGITARATENSNNDYAETIDTDAVVYGINETNNFVFGKATTNLVVTLDVSGSMADKVKDSSGNYTTRFEIAIDSMIETIEAYKVNGTTEVNLTLFGNGAKNIGWMTADEAIDYLNKLTLTSSSIKYNGTSISGLTTDGTDYYNALLKTMSVNFTGHEADTTVAYFLSDGEPNKNTSYTDSSSDTTIKNWDTYVSTYIDSLNVVGVGSGAKESSLNIIQVEDNTDVIMVTDDSSLGDILLGTVNATITGDVSDNLYGGDGKITINSIVVDGTEYTKSTFPTEGVSLEGDGKLIFNFETGTYSYTAKSSEFTGDLTKSFSVNASDEDGDTTKFDVNIKVDVGDTQTTNSYNISGEDIDLTSIISSNSKIDVINLNNSTNDKITIELDDLLVQEDKQLIVNGDNGDIIELDTPSDWTNAGKEQLDGVNYNVYTGTGENSTIKLLIEDEIEIKSDI